GWSRRPCTRSSAAPRSCPTRRCASPRPSSTRASRSSTPRLRSATGQSATSDELRERQMARLRAGVARVLATNALWRGRLPDVPGWDDFERLPLTPQAEVLADQPDHAPFGSNLTY